MKRRLLTFITALFILLLASNCTGIKPFFHADNASIFSGPGYRNATHINRNSDNYSYVPTSAQEDGLFNNSRGKHRFSVSIPASAKFEF